MEKRIVIDGVGEVTLRRSLRAKRYSLKIRGKEVLAVMPYQGSEALMRRFLEENAGRIRAALSKSPEPVVWDERTRFQTLSFTLRIVREAGENFRVRLSDGVLWIACPMETRFEEEAVQRALHDLVEKVMRVEAKRLLPVWVAELAERHGFRFAQVKISGSRTSWGSCSTRQSINLSLSLLLLPRHLIEYVILHELCHTVEMNHSPRFWALMDRVTDGKARALRQELKSYKPFDRLER